MRVPLKYLRDWLSIIRNVFWSPALSGVIFGGGEDFFKTEPVPNAASESTAALEGAEAPACAPPPSKVLCGAGGGTKHAASDSSLHPHLPPVPQGRGRTSLKAGGQGWHLWRLQESLPWILARHPFSAGDRGAGPQNLGGEFDPGILHSASFHYVGRQQCSLKTTNKPRTQGRARGPFCKNLPSEWGCWAPAVCLALASPGNATAHQLPFWWVTAKPSVFLNI